jgi:hypothetical protein
MIYRRPAPEEPITQGDILDHCPLVFWPATAMSQGEATPVTTTARVIVLTQACDLAENKASGVLVAIVFDAQRLVERGVLKSGVIRDQIRRHRVYGWYFLPADAAFRESVLDLRQLHTIPRVMLDRLVGEGSRVCRVTTPYREHLAQPFASSYARIGLPEPYETASD